MVESAIFLIVLLVIAVAIICFINSVEFGMFLMTISAIAGALSWPLKNHALFLFSLLVFPAGHFLYNKGKRKRAKKSPPVNFDRPDIVLYLRPFEEDLRTKRSIAANYLVGPFISWLLFFGLRTAEQNMAKKVKPYGVLAAIGHPNQKLPYLGAWRHVIKDEDWKSYVRRAIDKSKIIILRVGKKLTEGFKWELEQVLAAPDKSKLLILMPDAPEMYATVAGQLKEIAQIEVPAWQWRWNHSDFFCIIYFGKDSTHYFYHPPKSPFFTVDDNARAVGACLQIRQALHEGSVIKCMSNGFESCVPLKC